MARNPNVNRNRSEIRSERINRAIALEEGVNALADNLHPRMDEDAQIVTAHRLLPARLYAGLQGGPNWQRTYETQPGVPIDGSNPMARDSRFGSPFTFRVVPNETLVNSLLETENDSAGVNIISAAARADNTFAEYADKLERIRVSNQLSPHALNTIENFLAEGVLVDKSNLNDPENLIPAVVDLKVQADVLLQLMRMMETPSLTLLINPQSLTISHQKKQNYTERSRTNHIFQSWGEEQVKLSVSGKTGAFIAGDSPSRFHVARGRNSRQVTENGTATGVQSAAKRNSAAYQNLMNLLLFFRNNGYIYDRVGHSEAHLWIGSIAIDYDQVTYVGNFESFEYSYTSEQQNGGIDFSFEFTASRIYDNAQRTYFVEPIESPVPSPIDDQWSIPGPRSRNLGRFFMEPSDIVVNRPLRVEVPSALGNDPFGSGGSGIQTRPGTSPQRGQIRGGDF